MTPVARSAADADIAFIRELVRQRSGLVLDAGKRYLVESRLAPLIEAEGIGCLASLVELVRREKDVRLVRLVVEAMVTHETYFFRDSTPFETLRSTVLPELLRRGGDIHVWCAACSTGQEPYSLAMIVRDIGQDAMDRVRILATDISRAALLRAEKGIYNRAEVARGLPPALRERYFERREAGWEIRREVGAMVDFRQLNLAERWPVLPAFDVVLLRNVLIYFDLTTKRQVLGQLRQVMRNGLLFLGATESTFHIDEGYQQVTIGGSSAYRPGRPSSCGADAGADARPATSAATTAGRGSR